MTFKSDIIIGLEVHVELKTETKLFCDCKRIKESEDEKANTRVCPICLGHPGTRPSVNKKAVEFVTKLGLAVGSRISDKLIFSRKNYFYPDMSKNFQITQFENPIARGGVIRLKNGKEVHLTRIHLEEDPASLTYPGLMTNTPFSWIDYNRSGDPLAEIVTEPELNSPEEAREFMNQLYSILSYLEIFDINTCLIKSDVNVSIKDSGYSRVEIKNVNGFKEVEQALRYEITRQKMLVKRGMKIPHESRGWNKTGKTTFLQRVKETEDDYGYIIEPDLPKLRLNKKFIDRIKETIPELPFQKIRRFMKEYKLKEDDAYVMAMDKKLADIFEELASEFNASFIVNWLRHEFLRVLNYNGKSIQDIEFGIEEIKELLYLIKQDKISDKVAKRILEKLVEGRFSPKRYVEEKGLVQISSDKEIKELCQSALEKEEKAVSDYIAGEEKALDYLVGKVMALSRGKANPKKVRSILPKMLK
jgi:aspartyl-tRNA(Asn)/glutamyl-tRNA(Gln) amidotransferase subunit B